MFGQDEQSQNQDAGLVPDNEGVLASDHQTVTSTVTDAIEPTATTEPDVGIADNDNIGVPELPTLPTPAEPTDPVSDQAAVTTSTSTDELLDIKQQALQSLTPLVGHLEQEPEEKFRTTMMMIQAADNDSLIKTAYEAASKITDEKVRAQALLDIVNEINYFTHNANSEA